ncbi:MAG: hypothetical protein QM809_13765 [Gordonia sp. (in: high G+C Gram-positive bacteria)]|uniref:hypothetical protein n=1 Tax=Gordonia sp. (in: high G+C Gram-positive bacteria) TaxID=84139 RepID=UPI0039E2DB53
MTSGFDDDELEAYYRMIEARSAERGRPRRRREKAVRYEPPTCPTPEKIAYPTLAAVTGAILAVSRSSRQSPTLRCYECRCGAWHFTSSRRV